MDRSVYYAEIEDIPSYTEQDMLNGLQQKIEELQQVNTELALAAGVRDDTERVNLENKVKDLLERTDALEKQLGNAEREARDSKVYAGLVEKMLDKANDASSPSSEELIKELTEENKKLKESLDSLQIQCEAEREGFYATIGEADDEIIELQGKVKELNAQLETVTKERDESKEHAENITYQLEENTASHRSQTAELDRTIKELNEKRCDFNQQINALHLKHSNERDMLHGEITQLSYQLREMEHKWSLDKKAWEETVGTIHAAMSISRNDAQMSFSSRMDSEEAKYYRVEAQDLRFTNEMLIEEVKKRIQDYEAETIQRRNDVMFIQSQLTSNEIFWTDRVNAIANAHNESRVEVKELLEKKAELSKEVSRIQEEFLKKLEEVLSLKQVVEDLEHKSIEDQAEAQVEIEVLKHSKEAIEQQHARLEGELQMSNRLYRMECHVRRDCEKRCTNLNHEKIELSGMIVELETETTSMAEQIKKLVAERDAMEAKYRHVVENLGVEELSDEMLNCELEDEEEDEDEQESCDDEDEDEEHNDDE